MIFFLKFYKTQIKQMYSLEKNNFASINLSIDRQSQNFKAFIGCSKVLVCFVPTLIGTVGLYYGVNNLVQNKHIENKYIVSTVIGSISLAVGIILTFSFCKQKEKKYYLPL
ncbi:MAG: hypothetical protein K1060chlam5_00453 [Candidatus Anoxychlamydiales bacterium]|nr:hypothetical protein [Candidatus Anoxychlamydiales bacterium]